MNLLPIIIPIIIVEILTNSAWVVISYDWKVRGNVSLSYTLSILAGALSGWAWAYMALAMQKNQMFQANLWWDFLVTIIFLSLPILFYGVRLDLQSCIGTALAVIGLLLMK
jgi:uncharacterized membrane protein